MNEIQTRKHNEFHLIDLAHQALGFEVGMKTKR